MDISNPEVLQFLKSLYQNKVKYLLVGGVATTFHGHIRTTQDLDLWIEGSKENRQNLVKSLQESGVPGADHYLNVDLVAEWSTISIGSKGFIADFMEDLKGFSSADFNFCYERRIVGEYEGVPISVIHINDLIQEKLQSARSKDLDDVENLKKLKKG